MQKYCCFVERKVSFTQLRGVTIAAHTATLMSDTLSSSYLVTRGCKIRTRYPALGTKMLGIKVLFFSCSLWLWDHTFCSWSSPITVHFTLFISNMTAFQVSVVCINTDVTSLTAFLFQFLGQIEHGDRRLIVPPDPTPHRRPMSWLLLLTVSVKEIVRHVNFISELKNMEDAVRNF